MDLWGRWGYANKFTLTGVPEDVRKSPGGVGGRSPVRGLRLSTVGAACKGRSPPEAEAVFLKNLTVTG
jgi:hypothetical protein